MHDLSGKCGNQRKCFDKPSCTSNHKYCFNWRCISYPNFSFLMLIGFWIDFIRVIQMTRYKKFSLNFNTFTISTTYFIAGQNRIKWFTKHNLMNCANLCQQVFSWMIDKSRYLWCIWSFISSYKFWLSTKKIQISALCQLLFYSSCITL